MIENQYKIRLVAADAVTIAQRRAGVIFEVTPELSEARQVQYDFLDPVHAPGQIAVFKRSMSRRFQLSSVKFASRSPVEASQNLAYLWALRGWTMPNFGRRSDISDGVRDADTEPSAPAPVRALDNIRNLIEGISRGASQDYIGAPPQVLELSAYSRRGGNTRDSIRSIGHLYRVPCVIESLNITYPVDCDYIPTAERYPTPMPSIMNVDISLVETLSPRQLTNFSLTEFRLGILNG